MAYCICLWRPGKWDSAQYFLSGSFKIFWSFQFKYWAKLLQFIGYQKDYSSLIFYFNRFSLWMSETCLKPGSQKIRNNTIESQNGRSWKGPLDVIWCNTLLLKQGHLEQGTRPCVKVVFEYLQRRLQPHWASFSCALTLKVKQFFQMFRWNLLCSSPLII